MSTKRFPLVLSPQANQLPNQALAARDQNLSSHPCSVVTPSRDQRNVLTCRCLLEETVSGAPEEESSRPVDQIPLTTRRLPDPAASVAR